MTNPKCMTMHYILARQTRPVLMSGEAEEMLKRRKKLAEQDEQPAKSDNFLKKPIYVWHDAA